MEAVASTQVEQSAAKLSDLIDLYDPLGVTANGEVATGNDRSALTADDRKWLVLARQELAKLKNQSDEEAKEQLPAVKERMAAAEVVAGVRPEQAKLMYRAIIRLYGDKPWAAAEVKQAREKLGNLETE
jgi:hypothetical protein